MTISPQIELNGVHLTVIALVVVSALWDIRTRRIPNFLTYPAAIGAVAYHTVSGGAAGLYLSLCGLSLGLMLLVVFYFLGGMGAGDVKLMGAVGAMLGPGGVFDAFLYTAVIGGLYALFLLIMNGNLLKTLGRYGCVLRTFILTRSFMVPPAAERKKMPALCYGVAIAAGTLLSVFGQAAGWSIRPPFTT